MNLALDSTSDPRANDGPPQGYAGVHQPAQVPAQRIGKKREYASIKLHSGTRENNTICIFDRDAEQVGTVESGHF
jgi:hypothetical protein